LLLIVRAEKHSSHVHLSSVCGKTFAVSKSIIDYAQMLVDCKTICNKTKLRETPKVLTTTLFWKHNKGTRLIAEPNGKNVKNIWAIRSQAPKVAITRLWRRFNDYMVLGLRGLVSLEESLRYSLVPGEYPVNTPKGGVKTTPIKYINYFIIYNFLFILYFLNKIQKLKLLFHKQTLKNKKIDGK
jgi:hypothetical protein